MDSSSAVKFYVDEDGSQVMQNLRGDVANTFITSWITYVEVRSAFARRRREGQFNTEGDYRQVVDSFDQDWDQEFPRIQASESIIRLAGSLTERHGLRGYDAVHLASAITLNASEQAGFSSWDLALLAAAHSEGLPLAHSKASS